MLPRIRILQVGDVHLPEASAAGRRVDLKDRRFPIGLRNIVSSLPIKSVFRQIYNELVSNRKIDAVVFMGDLTDYGSISGYEAAAGYIAGALQLNGEHFKGRTRVGIIPGNHDINRELAARPGLAAKFIPLNAALQKFNLPSMPVEESKKIDINIGNIAAHLVLMNSCWGCGSFEFMPTDYAIPFKNFVDAVAGDVGVASNKNFYNRQLDTPAFSERSVASLARFCGDLPADHLMVIAAHHNLLPQRLMRLAPYTELINSGAVRSMLLDACRPIIYLHGHIHEDPIEIISTTSGGALVCISCTAAQDGFNDLEIVFTASGVPLVCHVYPWRFDNGGIFRRGTRRSVSLIGKRRRAGSPVLAAVYGFILKRKECYWNQLLTECRRFMKGNVDADLHECLELLASDGTISIENQESKPETWIVTANL